jgi:hypothetical protein
MSSVASTQNTTLSSSTIPLKQPLSSDANGIINKTESSVKQTFQTIVYDDEIHRMRQEVKLKKKQELSARNAELKKVLFLIESKIKFFFIELEAIRDDELSETLIKHRLILRNDLVNITKRCMELKSKYDAKKIFTLSEHEEIPCFNSFNNLLLDLFDIMPYFITYSISEEITTLFNHPQFLSSNLASSSSSSSYAAASNQTLKILFQKLANHIDAAISTIVQEKHIQKKEIEGENIPQFTCEILAAQDSLSSAMNDLDKIIKELLDGYYNPKYS